MFLRILGAVILISLSAGTYFIVKESRFFEESLIQFSVPVSLVRGRTDSDTLVVLLHGFNQPSSNLDGVKNTLAALEVDQRKSFDIMQPELPLGAMSLASHFDITAELLIAVDQAWANRQRLGKPYQEIIFVGHSYGAMLARKLYLVAQGEQAKAKFEPQLIHAAAKVAADPIIEPRPWADKVTRLVLLAGMNRGWSISHHMSIPRAFMMQAGVGVAYIVEFCTGLLPGVDRRLPVIMSLRRGAPFITQLRLQWIAMERGWLNSGKANGTVTVQLLGTVDDLVSPEDNTDLVSGANFVYMEVPGSGHNSIVDMDAELFETLAEKESAEARRKVFRDALSVTAGEPGHLFGRDERLVVEPDVTDLIFIIHGIRDEGYWTKKIARRVKSLGSQFTNRKIATETSTYGYFPMLSFLIPGARQEKVEWLMDKFTQAKARYPNAIFHYVGHSHGTYLLTRALQDYPSVEFGQVVFAGSVVRKEFEWHKYVPTRVSAVLNYVASADWVVAFFPKALESLNVQDLGSAGHAGFSESIDNQRLIRARAVDEYYEASSFVSGGHGAALQEQMWDN
ncbi:MAG: alpha/beta hydrolase, partial [Gammaproteobacteria bacterium]|nr:alpha/beta hydrolase [Gammaproteobacteria bacterium]